MVIEVFFLHRRPPSDVISRRHRLGGGKIALTVRGFFFPLHRPSRISFRRHRDQVGGKNSITMIEFFFPQRTRR
jgi:hypothetical protein